MNNVCYERKCKYCMVKRLETMGVLISWCYKLADPRDAVDVTKRSIVCKDYEHGPLET